MTQHERVGDELGLGGETVATVDVVARAPSEAEPAELVRGTSVGRYTVLELLGRGGMGAVYKAYDPELDRSIALKVIRPQSSGNESTVQAHGRVMREAQALAQLSHPNVVAVYDVGRYEGAVYIAMELVEGKTVREWLKDGTPSRSESLDVFRQAGQGLLAAHQAGLVHRDFKPANVILGKDGRVRVADFGLVRSLNAPPPELEPAVTHAAVGAKELSLESGKYLSASLTMSRAFLGTPHYMSPEQYRGTAIDGRADQYSFCVSLYQALYGEMPFEGRDLSELVENVLGGKRKAVPAAAGVPGWLRAILDKGLSRDAADRFASMNELLDALASDPEEAARRARHARRRTLQYAVGLAAALAAGVGLAALMITRGDQLCRAGDGELASVWNSDMKAKVRAAFMATGRSYADDTFGRVATNLDRWASAWRGMWREACEATHVKGSQSAKVLDLRMACLDRKLGSLEALVRAFADQPDGQVVTKAVEASLGLGTLAFCADVAALEQEEAPPERPEDRATLAELRGRLDEAFQLDNLGKYQKAASILEELAPGVDALGFEPLRAELAYARALTLRFLGKYADAEPLLREAIQVALRWRMMDLVARAEGEATFLIGFFLQHPAEGLVYALHAQGLTSGRGDQLELHSLNNLAIVRDSQGNEIEAQALYERALAIGEQALGPDHPDVAASLNNLGNIYRRRGKFAEAEAIHERVLALREKTLGPEHPDIGSTLNNLAGVYWSEGKYAEEEQLLQRARAIWEKALGPEHPLVAYSFYNQAEACRTQGKYDEAEELDKRALAIREKALGPEHPLVAGPLVGLAATYEQQRRLAEAVPLLERARDIRAKADAAPDERAEVAFALARGLWLLGDERARARSLAEEALALYGAAAGAEAESARVGVEQRLAAPGAQR